MSRKHFFSVYIFPLLLLSTATTALAQFIPSQQEPALQSIERPKQIVNFASSQEYYDQPPEQLQAQLQPNLTLENWYPNDPGWGFSAFETILVIPKNYLENNLITQDPQKMSGQLEGFTKEALAKIENQVPGVQLGSSTISQVVFLDKTLEEIICDSPTDCANPKWINLMRAVENSWPEENRAEFLPIFYVMGGAGVAYGGNSIFIGDCGFDQLFDYSVPGCFGIDGLERFRYTVIHEQIHSLGVPWHAPPYLTGPINDYTNQNIIDHPAYPEKWLICESTLNSADKMLCDQFANPKRVDVNIRSISGQVSLQYCPFFKYPTQAYLLENLARFGISHVLNSSYLQPDGSFTVTLQLPDKMIQGWVGGYGLVISDEYSGEDLNSSDFPLFFYNPDKQQFCDENTGTICFNPDKFLISSLLPEHQPVLKRVCSNEFKPLIKGNISCDYGPYVNVPNNYSVLLKYFSLTDNSWQIFDQSMTSDRGIFASTKYSPLWKPGEALQIEVLNSNNALTGRYLLLSPYGSGLTLHNYFSTQKIPVNSYDQISLQLPACAENYSAFQPEYYSLLSSSFSNALGLLAPSYNLNPDSSIDWTDYQLWWKQTNEN